MNIKTLLKQITKELEKSDKNIDQKIDVLKIHLNDLQEFKVYNQNGDEITSDEEKDLQRAIGFLEEQKKALELERDIKDNKHQKQLAKLESEEIQAYFKKRLLEAIEEAKRASNAYDIFKSLNKSNIINSFIDRARRVLELSNDSYPIKEYTKALNEVKQMYKTDIEDTKPTKKATKKSGGGVLGWLLTYIFTDKIRKI